MVDSSTPTWPTRPKVDGLSSLPCPKFGGLHLAHLNAGVTSWCSMGDDFDPEAYRRSMGINLDGVVYGIAAARPAIIASGGGTIVATASMAGLVAVPFDPIYAANKHAVVGLVRSIGDSYAAEGIKVHALCPSFAYTNIIKGSEQTLLDMGFPILDVSDVVTTFGQILEADSTGPGLVRDRRARERALPLPQCPGAPPRLTSHWAATPPRGVAAPGRQHATISCTVLQATGSNRRWVPPGSQRRTLNRHDTADGS